MKIGRSEMLREQPASESNHSKSIDLGNNAKKKRWTIRRRVRLTAMCYPRFVRLYRALKQSHTMSESPRDDLRLARHNKKKR